VARKPEAAAEGVWVVRGDLRSAMNVFFIEEDASVIQFDAGTKVMTKTTARAGRELGGLKRVVLGHGHTDHRGTAPGLDAPVYCHPDEVADAEREQWKLDYWDISKVEVTWVRLIYPALHRWWDGGPVEIAGTVKEGDSVGDFTVIDFPGHARGLIGLWRERDRVAIVSDTVYVIDSARLKPREPIEDPRGRVHGREPSVAHPAFNWDTDRARASVRKLAELRPRKVLTGHSEALEGDEGAVTERLLAAAEIEFERE
jgi:hydroxyacylglutathione hydrolase